VYALGDGDESKIRSDVVDPQPFSASGSSAEIRVRRSGVMPRRARRSWNDD
jgi:hypothetical protein